MSSKTGIFVTLIFFTVMLPLSMRKASGGNMIRCLDGERRALLELKDDLIDDYGRLSSWGTGENRRECCTWRGVWCSNMTNHVIGLNLSGQFIPQDPYHVARLRGKIGPSLLELKHLIYLNLSYNDFGSSPVPEIIGSLHRLQYLDLTSAYFGRTVPQCFGNLSKLIYLDVSLNFFRYESLDWVTHLRSLKYLDLRYSHVSETTNWLQAISKLNSITELYWEDSNLEDVLPSSLPPVNSSSTPLAILDLSRNYGISFSTFNWFLNFNNSSLTFIDFSFNNITGPISNYGLENHMSLAYLDLSYNRLEGGIPKCLGNMSSLMYLDLRNNRLIGQLPELMTNLNGPLEKNLQHLDLSYNKINGSLTDFSKFSSLTALGLGHNKLNGFVPYGYLNIPNLIALDLSSNSFTGPLPDFTSSPLIRELFLDNNMFNGPLTESIGRLSKLHDLFLGSNQLEGVVTESYFLNLSGLRSLELSCNSRLALNFSPGWVPNFQLKTVGLSACKLGPQFPRWLQFQSNLEFLDVSFNQISENIPSWFGKLASRLVYLNLTHNQIHGPFPNLTFTTSVEVDVSGNRMTGPMSFLCYTRSWRLLDLSDNLFSYQLPDCEEGFRSLQFLNLANNNFSGEIPDALCSSGSRYLLRLDLRNNSFWGSIPSSMRGCTSLEMIDLGSNRLSGEIPAWIGAEFADLVVLSLRSNEFSGAIPSSMCSLETIKVLDLSSNKFSGPIPKCLHFLKAMKTTETTHMEYFVSNYYFGRSISKGIEIDSGLLDGAYFMWKGREVKYVNHLALVTLIDLSDNNLVGDIPWEITQLVGLVALNLSRNNLTGRIPPHIGLLRSLDSLDLSVNRLYGDIPTSMWDLSTLGVLNLSYNNLSGRTPPISHFDASAYTGNSLLCGRPILDKRCPGDFETRSIGNGNEPSNLEHDQDDLYITKGFYICTAFGFIVGFWSTSGTMMLNKSIRCLTQEVTFRSRYVYG